MSLVLAFDIGTSGTKAALLDAEGRALASETRAYATYTGEGGAVEQDARDWWQAAVEAAEALRPRTADADYIVLTGQMQNVILIDDEGEPTRAVILYSDTRARAEAEAINSMFGARRLTELTGNGQGPSGLLAKLRWLRAHDPRPLLTARWLLTGAADYVAFRLTGEAASDTTTVSTTGLLHLAEHDWMVVRQGIKETDYLSQAAEADVRPLLPRLVAGGNQVGEVTAAAAQALGVRAGIPVYLGPGDAGAATLGAGAGEPGTPYGYIGTSGWVAYSASAWGDPAAGVFTLAHPRRDRVICVAPLLTAGGNLDWLSGLFAQPHAALVEAAAAAPSGGLLYLPYLNGERSPFSDPQAAGAFIGLRSHHTRADLARAVLEGVAFAYRHALDALVREPVTRLTLVGGGARSSAWPQIFADVTGVEVQIAADGGNVGLRGALLAAQVSRGERRDYSAVGLTTAQAVLRPDLTLRGQYDALYAAFRAAYPALKPVFAQLD